VNWPWRKLPSGRSLGLIPFLPNASDPPADFVYSLSNPDTKIMREIFPPPKKPVPRKEAVVWVHLHNFAGTNVCEKARDAGERISTKNCCWPGDNVMGRGWGEKFAHHSRCIERTTQSITLSMYERGLEAGDLGCPGSISGVMLREPFKGARSTVLYHGFQRELDMLQDVIEGKQTLPKMQSHRGMEPKFSYQFFDNYAIRSLSGNLMIPPGTVTREHLEEAKLVLERIDVVMILEEANDHSIQLQKLFKWPKTATVFQRKVNGHNDAEYETVTKAQEERFKAHNLLDYELYEYGKKVAADRSRFASGLA